MVGFLLESPEDPLSYDDRIPDCPSFWDWEEVKEFQRNHQLDLTSFDQGIVGHPQEEAYLLPYKPRDGIGIE